MSCSVILPRATPLKAPGFSTCNSNRKMVSRFEFSFNFCHYTKGSVRSGKYFDKKAIVTKGHTIDWDGWILSAMMDLGFICVYGQ